MYFHCYYCEFETDIDKKYQDHCEHKHNSNPYPNIKEVEEKGLQKQGKLWESFP
jgi:hypothetical protein